MVLLWPVDIKSDGGNPLSMFASQDLNPALPRRRISSSSFTKNAGLYRRAECSICVSQYIVTFHYGLLSRQNKTLYALFFCYHDVIQLEKVLDGTLKGLLEES